MNRIAVPASVVALLATSALSVLPIFNGPFDTDVTIVAHRERQATINESSQTILAKAEAENRDLTEAEQKEVEDLADEFDSISNQIGLRERVLTNSAQLSTGRGRQTSADRISDADDDDDRPLNRGGQRPEARRAEPRPLPATARGTGGFRSMGHFADAVRAAALGNETDARLRNAAAATIGTEGSGADGGFAVPADFRTEIATKVFGEDSLVARTDRMRTSSNSIVLPSDMTTPWDTTGGIQAYWGAEAGTMTQSKPKLEDVTYKAHKLHVLVPMSEELLEDAPAMDSYLRRKAPEKMDFKISDALVRGTGAGQPLGILNSTALVTVAAEGGQAADSLLAANIARMYGRMPASSRGTAVWLINPDTEVLLEGLLVGQQPVYMPPGGLSEAPYGRMKGRPVISHQVCSAVGDVGDIMFVDWEQYMTLTKLGAGRDDNGFKADVSMHLWFDQDLAAFKFTIRIGGQPWWSVSTPPAHGAANLSPYIALAAR